MPNEPIISPPIVGGRNVDLLEATMRHIEAHPEQHDQFSWAHRDTECGTAACFAGWAAILVFGPQVVQEDGGFACPAPYNDHKMSTSAQKLLGITPSEGYTLFDATNSAQALRLMVNDLVAGRTLNTAEYYESEVEALEVDA